MRLSPEILISAPGNKELIFSFFNVPRLGVLTHNCNTSSWEVKAGRPGIQGHSHYTLSESEATLGSGRPCIRREMWWRARETVELWNSGFLHPYPRNKLLQLGENFIAKKFQLCLAILLARRQRERALKRANVNPLNVAFRSGPSKILVQLQSVVTLISGPKRKQVPTPNSFQHLSFPLESESRDGRLESFSRNGNEQL